MRRTSHGTRQNRKTSTTAVTGGGRIQSRSRRPVVVENMSRQDQDTGSVKSTSYKMSAKKAVEPRVTMTMDSPLAPEKLFFCCTAEDGNDGNEACTVVLSESVIVSSAVNRRRLNERGFAYSSDSMCIVKGLLLVESTNPGDPGN